jgi:hypothetical protein
MPIVLLPESSLPDQDTQEEMSIGCRPIVLLPESPLPDQDTQEEMSIGCRPTGAAAGVTIA